MALGVVLGVITASGNTVAPVWIGFLIGGCIVLALYWHLYKKISDSVLNALSDISTIRQDIKYIKEELRKNHREKKMGKKGNSVDRKSVV